MSDDKSKRHADGKLISLTQDHEVEYWTRALEVDEHRLREAVAAVGHAARAVRVWLAANAGAPPD